MCAWMTSSFLVYKRSISLDILYIEIYVGDSFSCGPIDGCGIGCSLENGYGSDILASAD